VRSILLLSAAAVAAAIALGGCGNSASADKTAGSSNVDKPASGSVAIAAREFAFDRSTIQAKPGKLTITMKNSGKFPHELVLLKTGAAADALKVSGGKVSEKAAVGEISETGSGASKSATFHLKPGSYVYVCNIPGHYADGMRGTLTVR
jgi:plastocyanin